MSKTGISLWERMFDAEKRYEHRALKGEMKSASNTAKLEVLTGEAEEEAVEEAAAEEIEEVEIETTAADGTTRKTPVKLHRGGDRQRKGGQKGKAQQKAMKEVTAQIAALQARMDEVESDSEGMVQHVGDRQRKSESLGAALYSIIQGLIAIFNVGDVAVSPWALAGSKMINVYLLSGALELGSLKSGPQMADPAGKVGRRGQGGKMSPDTTQWLLVASTALYAYAYYDSTVGLSSLWTTDDGNSLLSTTSLSTGTSTEVYF